MTLQEFKKLPWIQNFKEQEWHLTIQIPTNAMVRKIQYYQKENNIPEQKSVEDAIRNVLEITPVSVDEKYVVLRIDELVAFDYIEDYNNCEILFWDLETRELRLIFAGNE